MGKTKDAAKAVEKASRSSAYDGVPRGLPALSRAQKLEGRRVAAGAPPATRRADDADAGAGAGEDDDAELVWGRDLLDVVDRAGRDGIDAERALRRAVRERETQLRAVEPRRDDA